MSGGSSRSSRVTMDVLELNFLTVQLADEGLKEMKNKRERSDSRGSGSDTCDEQLRIITLDQLARHDRHDDCWIAVFDRIYDCTDFIAKHPGGLDVILEYAGRDATLAFVGYGHSAGATAILQDYLVGQLPSNERLFLVPNGIKVATRNG